MRPNVSRSLTLFIFDGDFEPGSDIDITLIAININIHKLNKIKNDLDELNLPYTFDISLLSEIENSDLRDHIERVGIIFYSKTCSATRVFRNDIC